MREELNNNHQDFHAPVGNHYDSGGGVLNMVDPLGLFDKETNYWKQIIGSLIFRTPYSRLEVENSLGGNVCAKRKSENRQQKDHPLLVVSVANVAA